MEINIDRIRSLEASREIMQRKLKETFELIEKLDEKYVKLQNETESIDKRLKSLMVKVDGITDGLIKIEEETKRLKELSHEHKIIK